MDPRSRGRYCPCNGEAVAPCAPSWCNDTTRAWALRRQQRRRVFAADCKTRVRIRRRGAWVLRPRAAGIVRQVCCPSLSNLHARRQCTPLPLAAFELLQAHGTEGEVAAATGEEGSEEYDHSHASEYDSEPYEGEHQEKEEARPGD